MPAWGWIVIVVAIVALAAVAWYVFSQRRTTQLRDRFGPEYDRVSGDVGSKREAESELREREARRENLEIRPLDEASRTRYQESWQDVQKQFVDDPPAAVDAADSLLRAVMGERGYPAEEDFDRRAADVSVDHPHVVESYREGRRLAHASRTDDDSTTENLRKAMNHYRALFEELVGSAREPQRA
jgi:hypothetical protein